MMKLNLDTALTIREFTGGPLDGLVMEVPANTTCYYLPWSGFVRFGRALGGECFYHAYVPGTSCRLRHIHSPARLMPCFKERV